MVFQLALGIGMTVILMAFVAEYVDSTIGMGYGTSLTPILLLMGFEPLQVVPAILLSEFVTGILAGVIHNEMGNVDFGLKAFDLIKIRRGLKRYGIIESYKKGVSAHLKIAIFIGVCSIIGSVAGVVIAVSISSFYIKLYIGILVLVIGIYILATLKKSYHFAWNRLMGMAIIASFNKGISGGGYGPVVTGGQLLAGVDSKNAIAITSLAEGLTCIVGLIVYFTSFSAIDWSLAPYLLVGGVLSVPLSGFTVKKINTNNLRVIIGVVMVVLGCVSLGKVLL